MTNDQVTVGFVPARRGLFSEELAVSMRRQTIEAMEAAGIKVIVPGEDLTALGCVESIPEAESTARLFDDNDVQGVVVGAMNFGDERSAAWTLKSMREWPPVLLFGCQEEGTLTPEMERRDAFCGLLSIAEALRQVGVKYSLPETPVCLPTDEAFTQELRAFGALCRVVKGLRRARYGQVGTRPDAFWTCRANEKALQLLGPTVFTLDLSEVLARAHALRDDDGSVREVVSSFREYADTAEVNDEQLLRMAKLEVVLKGFVEEKDLDGLAIQCWTSMQENYGITPCAVMARLGDQGTPCACEVDTYGLMSMHALRLAAGQPSSLADWNNLDPADPEVVSLWHCGVYPASMGQGRARIGYHRFRERTVGRESAYGTLETRLPPGPLTLCRIQYDDSSGQWKAFVGTGQVEEHPGETFGAYGWTRIPNLRQVYRDVLLRHFAHHVGFVQRAVSGVLREALGRYLGMAMFTN